MLTFFFSFSILLLTELRVSRFHPEPQKALSIHLNNSSLESKSAQQCSLWPDLTQRTSAIFIFVSWISPLIYYMQSCHCPSPLRRPSHCLKCNRLNDSSHHFSTFLKRLQSCPMVRNCGATFIGQVWCSQKRMRMGPERIVRKLASWHRGQNSYLQTWYLGSLWTTNTECYLRRENLWTLDINFNDVTALYLKALLFYY